MKIITRLLAALACFTMAAAPALATDIYNTNGAYYPNYQLLAATAATAGYTNATTSYTDITGASVTVPATRGDPSLQYFRVCYWADVTKATSTTGTIQVVANGAAITASRRTVASAAGQTSVSECYTVARASAASSTIKLQAVSGDTATFTIANLQMEVSIIRTLSS